MYVCVCSTKQEKKGLTLLRYKFWLLEIVVKNLLYNIIDSTMKFRVVYHKASVNEEKSNKNL